MGDAGQVLWDCGEVGSISLHDLTSLLRARRLAEKHRAELRSRRRRPGESVFALHQDICRMLALAEPDLPRELRDRMGMESFIIALDDAEFELKMSERTPETLSEAITLATTLDGWMIDARKRMVSANQESAKSDDVNPLRHTKGKTVRAAGGTQTDIGQTPLTRRI